MGVLVAFAFSKPDIRSNLFKILKATFHRKLAPVWLAYVAWVILFVVMADWLGIWHPVLTKDTLVWGGTTGIVLLLGLTDANEAGYFQRTILKIAGIVVIFEYLVNLATFPFLIEILLQPLIFILMVAPTIVKEPSHRETWLRIRVGFTSILLIVIGVHTIQTLQKTWETLDLSLIALRAVWPMILGLWVLVLVFALAVITTYEQAFVRLQMYRDESKGLWKAKLGLILALRIRLGLIREAAKGGTIHVANSDSVVNAYKAAKRFETEINSSQQRKAR